VDEMNGIGRGMTTSCLLAAMATATLGAAAPARATEECPADPGLCYDLEEGTARAEVTVAYDQDSKLVVEFIVYNDSRGNKRTCRRINDNTTCEE
jgi:hypothetical protein